MNQRHQRRNPVLLPSGKLVRTIPACAPTWLWQRSRAVSPQGQHRVTGLIASRGIVSSSECARASTHAITQEMAGKAKGMLKERARAMVDDNPHQLPKKRKRQKSQTSRTSIHFKVSCSSSVVTKIRSVARYQDIIDILSQMLFSAENCTWIVFITSAKAALFFPLPLPRPRKPAMLQLRDAGLALGAKYRPGWGPDCTHLVCAFAHTPKYLEVQGRSAG